MSGNTFGRLFRVTTWGESHGPALGVVVDGCPPGLELTEAVVQEALDRRRPGRGGVASTSRREPDRVEILSGVFEGRTTGTPISMLIRNQDAQSSSYEALREVFRPGHGDITYHKKYGIRDHRGGGRSSGRETAARVAAGAVAGLLLGRHGIEVTAFTLELAGIRAQVEEGPVAVDDAPLFCPDREAAKAMEERLKELRARGDSAGGIVEVRAFGVPAGLGEPVFDKLDADLAKALMSVGAVKGVEIGAGFRAAAMTGSEHNDEILPHGFATNNAGGILAGISNGDTIVVRAAVKPIPSISQEQRTIDIHGNPTTIKVGGRHDRSAIPRIVPVLKAMVQITLADHLLRQMALERAANGGGR